MIIWSMINSQLGLWSVVNLCIVRLPQKVLHVLPGMSFKGQLITRAPFSGSFPIIFQL